MGRKSSTNLNHVGYDKSVKVSKKDVLMITLTFINCSIGPGMMSIPKVVSTTGLICGYLFLAIATLYIFFFTGQVTHANYHGNFDTYPELMRSIWGKKWGLLLDISLVLCNTGFLTSYVTVSADYIRTFIYYFGKFEVLETETWRRLFKVIVSVVIFVPLSLLRTIDSISNLTAFSFIFSLIAVVMITIRFFQFVATGRVAGVDRSFLGDDENVFTKYFTPMPNRIPSLFSYFYSFFVFFTIHASLTPMQREFGAKKKNNKHNNSNKKSNGLISTPSQRMKTITKGFRISTFIVLIIYLIVATEGVFMFDRSCTRADGTTRDNCVLIDSNILLLFKNDTPIMVIMLLYSVVVIIGYPCLLYPVRTSLCKWLNVDRWNGKGNMKVRKTRKSEMKEMNEEDYNEFRTKSQIERKKQSFTVRNGYFVYCMFGVVIIIINCVLSVFVPEIDRMSALITNICGVFIFEISGLFVFYKRKLIRKYSIGNTIDKAMNEWEIINYRENNENASTTDENLNKESVTTDKSSLEVDNKLRNRKNSVIIINNSLNRRSTLNGPRKSISEGSEKKKGGSISRGLKRFGQFRRTSLMNTEGIKNKYSFYVGDMTQFMNLQGPDKKNNNNKSKNKANKKGKKAKQYDLEGVLELEYNQNNIAGGERTWSEEVTESDVSNVIDMPKIDTTSTDSTQQDNRFDSDAPVDSSTNSNEISNDGNDNINKSPADKVRLTLQSMHNQEKRSKSLIIMNEDNNALDVTNSSFIENSSLKENSMFVEAVFPNVSDIDPKTFHKHPKCSKALLICGSVFFVALAITAIACDIYGWVTY